MGFVLWDGSTIPADLSPSALAIVIADEGAIAALIRRPKLDTLLNLVVSARLDLRNGTIFDLMAQRPRVRPKHALKAIEEERVELVRKIVVILNVVSIGRLASVPLRQVAAHRFERPWSAARDEQEARRGLER
jgi:hypothetical protein